MKRKNILSVISSVVLAAAMSATALTGCNRCEHAYRWTTEKESTCVTQGVERGVCGICGDVTTRKIPVDPDNHAYGEWQIDPPTENEVGTATKVCTLDSSHVLSVTLPVITSNAEGYFSEGSEFSGITKVPTAIEEGSFHGILKNDEGDIVFDATLPKRELETVEDAVLLGSSLAGLIRSTSGKTSDSVSGVTTTYYSFSADFGDDYTHVVNEGDKTESWISYDDEGKPFGISQKEGGAPVVMENITEKHLLGYGYSSGATGDSLRTFGAEDTLLSYYNRAKVASENGKAVKYSESELTRTSDGGVTASFEYSYFENPFFARYYMEFELYPSGAIKNLTLTTKIIRDYMVARSESNEMLFDEDGDIIYAEEYAEDEDRNPLYEYDANGNIVYEGVKTDSEGNILHDARGNEIPRPKPLAGTKTSFYSDDHPEVSTRVLIYENQVLKTENDEVAENPYDSNVLYIASFDVLYDSQVVGEESITVPSNTQVKFNISNIEPSTATLDYDPLIVYVRTPLGDKELNLDYNNTPYNIIGAYIKTEGVVSINSKTAGDMVLVLKTKGGKAEKVLNIYFDKGAPSTINAQVYTYSDAGGNITYGWEPYDIDSTLQLYVGQSVYVKAVADASEAGYADTSFFASCLNDGYFEIEDDVDFNGEKVSVITPIKTGTNRMYLEYTKPSTDPSAQGFAAFNIMAVSAPEVSSLFKGEYATTLKYVKVGNDIKPAEVKAVFDYETDWRNGTISLTVGEDEFEYVYSYDEATRRINVTGGITDETYDFTFAVNEVYRITITHSTGFPGITETMALLPQ